MYQKQNNRHELSCPLQRSTIRGFLGCSFCIYLFFWILYILSFINLVRLGEYSKIYPTAGFAVVFLIAAIWSKTAQNQLAESDLSGPSFKKKIDGVICMNTVLIVLNVVTFLILLFFLVVAHLKSEYKEENNMYLPLMTTLALLQLFPFIILAMRHKEVKKCLLEVIMAAPVSADQVSLANGQGLGRPGYGFVQDP